MDQNHIVREVPKTLNCTVNGQCSGCGECCSDLLPLTKKDIKRLNHYIKKQKIGLRPKENDDDISCPFLNENNRCNVYEARPMICRVFSCSAPLFSVIASIDKRKPTTNSSMRFVFGGDSSNLRVLESINKELALMGTKIEGK